MDQRTTERGKGARKAIAAQPAPTDEATEPAPAPKGRRRRQQPPSEEPGKAKTSLLNEGNGSYQGGKESAPRRKTSLANSTPKAEKCDPAGEYNNPTEEKSTTLQKKQERRLKTNAPDQEKAGIALGAAAQGQNHVPREQEQYNNPTKEKGAALQKKQERRLKTNAPDQEKAGIALGAAAQGQNHVPREDERYNNPTKEKGAALQKKQERCLKTNAPDQEKAGIALGAAAQGQNHVPREDERYNNPTKEKGAALQKKQERRLKTNAPDQEKAGIALGAAAQAQNHVPREEEQYNNPTEEKGAALQKKQERRLKTNAPDQEKAGIALGAAAQAQNHVPREEEQYNNPTEEKGAALQKKQERRLKTNAPDQEKAGIALGAAAQAQNHVPREEEQYNNPTEEKGAALQKKQERRLKTNAPDQEKARIASGAAAQAQNHVPREEGPDPEEKEAPPRGKKASLKARPRAAKEPEPRGAEAVPRGRPAACSLKHVLQSRLMLRRAEISDAAGRVNAVRDLVEKAVSRKLPGVIKVGTGSYYEHLKITKPDEFDIMLKVPEVRVELEPYTDGDCKGAYYFVKLKRNPKLLQLDGFVDKEQLHLSASKVISELRDIITDEIKAINGMKVTMEKKKPGSPAVTLRIGEQPSEISVDIILALEMQSKTLGNVRKGGPDLKKWLGVKVQQELDKMNLCLVPKNAKEGAHFRDTWRLSFSLAEKMIIQYHGNSKTCCEAGGKKCCRKDCLKLLKHLLEQLKTKYQSSNQFNKFCSYHAKTAFFHTCTKWTSDEEWDPTKLDECFERLLDYFLDCLRKVELNHFFIPECNLFCPHFKCNILAKEIENERTNGFPIFKQT